MTVKELLVRVRQRLGDMQKLTFSDEELLFNLNNAMDELCISMSTSFDPEIIKTITLTTNGFTMPEDFIAWQGQYALNYLENEDGSVHVYPLDSEWDGNNDVLRYFAAKPHFTSMNDKVPFRTQVHCNRLIMETISLIKGKGGGNTDSQGTAQTDGGEGTS